ncbi:hypothetical protein ADIS_3007 [Lunatimonas lonarensis]|uniref:Uncharacterized protein n=1 Tax=Lunatimonas lonarensis TaxID=1232681 RepID=R7ZR49_9BACT|nr:hypothetical protein ADIS_3007 [Lunatimonas lonarensis]
MLHEFFPVDIAYDPFLALVLYLQTRVFAKVVKPSLNLAHTKKIGL